MYKQNEYYMTTVTYNISGAHIVVHDSNVLCWCLNIPLPALLFLAMNGIGVDAKINEVPAECPAGI